MKRDQLLVRFANSYIALGGRGEAIESFNLLKKMYSEKFRYYHGISHIAQCIKKLDTINPSGLDLDVTAMALFLHDAIYNPMSKCNEIASAFLARAWFPGERSYWIVNGILSTGYRSLAINPEDRYIVDIDLSILGASEDEYEIYRKAIRKEFSYYSDKEFNAGRTLFLRQLLKVERIFLTEVFYNCYEKQARINIHKEIDCLNAL